MGNLVSDLLTQATTEGGRMEHETLELNGPQGLLSEVVAGLDLADHVIVCDLPLVEVDTEMVRQLFTNLISNAAKYVAPGTEPRIEVRGTRRGSRVDLELLDNGIGIPDRDRDHVFDRFYRAHANEQHYSGTGLGLAICQTVVERHGGTIRCRPRVDPDVAASGACFAFDLPAATPA